MLIEKCTALIVVAQIALLRPIRECAPTKPHVMSMVLANGFGRVLAILDSGPQEAVVPPNVIESLANGPRRPRCVELSWNASAMITSL